MESEREDWDLDGVFRDIWAAAASPIGSNSPALSRRSKWPWLPSSSSYSTAADPPFSNPAAPLFSAHPDSTYHHDFHNHDRNNIFSVHTSSVPSPYFEWRAESLPSTDAEAAPKSSTQSLVEEEEPKKAEEEGAIDRGNVASRDEKEAKRTTIIEDPPVSSMDGVRNKWPRLTFAIPLWRKVGPEMAKKIGHIKGTKKEARVHMLQNLTEREEIEQRRQSAQSRRVRRSRSEMFGTVEINAILQGVIYAAVADTSIFTCGDFWGPLILVLAVTVGTIVGLIDRYRQLRKHKILLSRMTKRMSGLKKIITDVKDSVLAEDDSAQPHIDLDKLYREVPPSLYCQHEESQDGGGGDKDEDDDDIQKMWRPVFAFSVIVSVGVLNAVSCYKILCSCDCRC